jgi:DNA-directed RNA polymerase subunit RPC12/RpoP
LTYTCNKCLTAVSVIVDGPGAQLVDEDDYHKCPWCSEGTLVTHPVLGKAARQGGPFKHEVMSAEDFYRAVRGMGMPGEYGADPALVHGLFQMGRVCGLSMEGHGSPVKTVVHSIRLETPDGRFDLHMGPSTQGAVIYRISEVRDERPETGSTEPDRAQVGPAAAPPADGDGGDRDAADAGPDALPGLQGPDQVRT